MLNTINKVNPGNRINFTKLRKGGQIPKFKTPAGGVQKVFTNTRYTSGNNSGWSETIFTPEFQQKLFAVIQNPNSTNEQRAEAVKAINNLQKAYEDLRKRKTISNPVEFDQAVKDYQQRIISEIPELNTMGITNGINNNRYTYAQKRISGDSADSNGNWGTDGLWGSQTQDRTVLGYNGDWDESSDRYTQMNEALKQYGFKVEKGLAGDNNYTEAYYINPFAQPETQTEPEEPAEPTTQTEPEKTTEPTTQTEPVDSSVPSVLEFQQQPKRQSTPWTDWAPLTTQLANNLLNNQRQYNNEIQKKFTLEEAPYKQGLVTNNYAARQMRSQMAADIRSRANRNLTSDSTTNQIQQNAAEAQALGLEDQNALDQTQEFNRTSKELQAIGNENKAIESSVANYNRKQNAAAWNNILVARQRRDAANTAELNSYIGNMYSSHGQWLQNERMEDARFQRDINDYNYQQRLQRLYNESGLEALEGGIQNSQAFGRFRSVIEHGGDTYNIPLDENGKITDQALLDYIKANPNDAAVKSALSEYQSELDNANNLFTHKQQSLIAERQRANMLIPGTFSNQGTRFGDRYIRHTVPGSTSTNPLYTESYKSGGKFRNARFIDYMNHYQKQQQFDRVETRKNQERLQKKLARDLDYLDKETLLLLKQIFK